MAVLSTSPAWRDRHPDSPPPAVAAPQPVPANDNDNDDLVVAPRRIAARVRHFVFSLIACAGFFGGVIAVISR